jgi:inorganic phosphate transporter, PiT family
VEAAFALAVVAALAFAFTNGFHDAANVIATLVATRGASPGAAIALAAVCSTGSARCCWGLRWPTPSPR